MRQLLGYLILLTLAGSHLDAQTISGFAGMAWGSHPDSATAHYGKPLQSGKDESAASWFLFNDHVLGRDVQVYLLYSPDHGLIKGAYAVPFGMGSDCTDTFAAFRQAIADRYPSIKPQEDKTNTSTLDFCGGVSIGKASWTATWNDPSPPARVYMLLKPEARVIGVHYEGPHFDNWDTARAARERAKKF